MINIEELRRLVQAATPGPWKMLPVGDGRQKFAVADSEFLSILTVTDEGGATFGTVYYDADAKFIAATNPAVISELLDRLEAAESDAAHQKALADSALRVAEGWERKCATLRNEIAEMKQQEPVATIRVNSITGNPSVDLIPGHRYLHHNSSLYTLPGAQNVPEKLCYDSRWEISIDYVDGWNAAIDAVRGKSPSWYCPDCCIVFPFGEPKSCPHDDARCNRALKAEPEAEGK